MKSRFEFVTSAALRQKGYDPFLASYRNRRRWSDRTKEIETPLFPGYVFCRFDASNPYEVLNTTGVIHVVSAGKTPLPLDDREVATLQALCRSGLPAVASPLISGQRVSICHGPLSGMEAEIVETRNECRIVVSISVLQRSVTAEIDREWVHSVSRQIGAGI